MIVSSNYPSHHMYLIEVDLSFYKQEFISIYSNMFACALISQMIDLDH